jgi:tetratricopeptide (TPR) repeat protein
MATEVESEEAVTLHFVSRSAPQSDARNLFRRVVESYFAERPSMSGPYLSPLLEMISTPLGEVETALFDLQKAQELFERIGDKEGIAIAVANMGTVYATVACYPDALICFARALALFGTCGDIRNVARCSANIGVIQVALPTHMRALEILTEALQVLPLSEGASPEALEDLEEVFSLLALSVEQLESVAPAFCIFHRR